MAQLTKEEIIKEFDDFINEVGMFYRFKAWIKERGYTLKDFGIEDEPK